MHEILRLGRRLREQEDPAQTFYRAWQQIPQRQPRKARADFDGATVSRHPPRNGFGEKVERTMSQHSQQI